LGEAGKKPEPRWKKQDLERGHGARHGRAARFIYTTNLSPLQSSGNQQLLEIPRMTRVGSVPLPLVSSRPWLIYRRMFKCFQQNSALHRIDALISRKFGEVNSKTRGHVTGPGWRVFWATFFVIGRAQNEKAFQGDATSGTVPAKGERFPISPQRHSSVAASKIVCVFHRSFISVS